LKQNKEVLCVSFYKKKKMRKGVIYQVMTYILLTGISKGYISSIIPSEILTHHFSLFFLILSSITVIPLVVTNEKILLVNTEGNNEVIFCP